MSDEKKKPETVGDAGAYTNFVSSLGTSRDKASHGHFVLNEIPDEQIEAVYRNWLAKRIVNRPASDMLRAGWFYEGIKGNDLTKLQEACKHYRLDNVLLSALILSRKNGVAYVLIGAADGNGLDQPFELDKLGMGRLEFFTVVKKKFVQPITTSYLSPSVTGGLLKQPEFYNLQFNDGATQKKIHHSRLIIFKHADVDGEDSCGILQEVYEDLLNHASVNKASASLVHESKIDVIRTPNLVNKIKEDMAAVVDRFLSVGLLKGINGMMVLDKEEEFESKSYTFTGLPEMIREYSIQASGAAEMPYTILFGQSPAGMNATGEHDTRNYYDSIATKQEWNLKPVLMKLLALIIKTTFGRQFDNLNVVFNPLWQLDPKVRSEVEKANSERDAKYLEMGVINELQIAQQLVIDEVYSVIDETHIATLDSMVGQIDDSATGT